MSTGEVDGNETRKGEPYQVYEGPVHNTAGVTQAANWHLVVDNPRALRVVEALREAGRGRLIVLQAPAVNSWESLFLDGEPEDEAMLPVLEEKGTQELGPIGCVLPHDSKVGAAVLALVTGSVYVLRPEMHENEDGEVSDSDFIDTFYPNPDPIRVQAKDAHSAEAALLSRLPYDRSTILKGRHPDPEQRAKVSAAIKQALETIRTVDFAAMSAERVNEVGDEFFEGLGEFLGVEDKQE